MGKGEQDLTVRLQKKDRSNEKLERWTGKVAEDVSQIAKQLRVKVGQSVSLGPVLCVLLCTKRRKRGLTSAKRI